MSFNEINAPRKIDENYDPRSPIEYISISDAHSHARHHAELKTSTVDQLTLTPDTETVEYSAKFINEDGEADFETRSFDLVQSSSSVTEQQVNNELRTRLLFAEQSHAAFGDAVMKKIEQIEAKKAKWRQNAYDVRDCYVKIEARLKQVEKDERFHQRVIGKKNDEIKRLTNENTRLTNENERFQEQIQALQEKMAKLKAKRSRHHEERKKLQDRIWELEEDNDTLTGLLEIWMPKAE